MADAEEPNSNRRRLLLINSHNAGSFFQLRSNRHMILEEMRKGDAWIVDWFWDAVLSTNFAGDFFQLQAGCKIFLGWVKVASSISITHMLIRFHSLGAYDFVGMACTKAQHQVVLAFIDASKNLPYQVELIVSLLQRGGWLVFTDQWGHAVLTNCLNSFKTTQCTFIFDHVRDYFASCVRKRFSGTPHRNFISIIKTCFVVGTVDWVRRICAYIAEEGQFFSGHSLGAGIILNLLDESQPSSFTLSKLQPEQFVTIKEVLKQKLISGLPNLSYNRLSYEVVRTFLERTMESDPPTYLVILTGLESAIIASKGEHGVQHSLESYAFVNDIVTHAQSEFKPFYLREKAILNPDGMQFITIKAIAHRLTSLGRTMMIHPNFLDGVNA